MTCDKSPEKIKELFNEIAKYYDYMNDVVSFGTHKIIKYLVIKSLNLKPRAMVLDLCCGTGDLSNFIQRIYPRVKVIGVDFSEQMIKIAKTRFPKGVFICADCTNLPFKDKEIDYITMGFGLRNIENRQKAIEEIYRILDFGGQFMHLDFGEHNKISGIFDFVVPILSKLFKKKLENYEYLIESKRGFPVPNDLIKEFEQVGFKLVKRRDYLFKTISAQILEK